MKGDLFYPLSIIIVAVFLSIYKTFDTKEEEIDFYPTTLDKNIYRKILWYFSQITYSSNFFLLIYFILKIFKFDTNILFKIIAPICLSVNLNYFLVLYPKKNIKLYEIPFHSLVLHFMTTFIIINELKYITYNSFNDVLQYNYFVLYGIIITILNYNVRGIWSYGVSNLFTKKGWKFFFQFNIISFISSLFLYLYKLN
mgnify:CR=1 FL=1